MVLFDQDQNEFALYATAEGRKQKSLNQKKKELIDIEIVNNQNDVSDKEADDKKVNFKRDKGKKYLELQNKINNYI